MTSENVSKTQQTEERRQKMLRLAEDYSLKLGLGKLQPTNDVEKYLNLTQPELRRMTAEDCGEAAYFISRAMTYIQLETNKVQADINWCEQYMHWLIASVIHTVGGQYTPFEYKRLLAIKQNDVAMELQKIIVAGKVRLDTMAFVTTQLRGLLTTFEGLQQTKRAQRQ
jgi:hypothetical protein